MSTFLIAAVAVMVVGISLWGWGWAARRCIRHPPLPHALTVAVGLAVVIFLGGILNLVHLVHPFTLNLIMTFGLALTGSGWLLSGRPPMSRPSAAALCAAVPLVGAGWFLA